MEFYEKSKIWCAEDTKLSGQINEPGRFDASRQGKNELLKTGSGFFKKLHIDNEKDVFTLKELTKVLPS